MNDRSHDAPNGAAPEPDNGILGPFASLLECADDDARIELRLCIQDHTGEYSYARTMPVHQFRAIAAPLGIQRRGRPWTTAEVAGLFGVEPCTVRRWIADDDQLRRLSGAYRPRTPTRSGQMSLGAWCFPEEHIHALIEYKRHGGTGTLDSGPDSDDGRSDAYDRTSEDSSDSPATDSRSVKHDTASADGDDGLGAWREVRSVA